MQPAQLPTATTIGNAKMADIGNKKAAVLMCLFCCDDNKFFVASSGLLMFNLWSSGSKISSFLTSPSQQRWIRDLVTLSCVTRSDRRETPRNGPTRSLVTHESVTRYWISRSLRAHGSASCVDWIFLFRVWLWVGEETISIMMAQWYQA